MNNNYLKCEYLNLKDNIFASNSKKKNASKTWDETYNMVKGKYGITPHFTLIRAIEAYLFLNYTELDKRTLDVGCGDGVFAEFIGLKSISVGIDINTKSLIRAKQSGIYDMILYNDASKLSLKSNQFDQVISNCAIEHMNDIDKVLSEVSRVLKSNGKFMFSVPCNFFLKNFYENSNLIDKDLATESILNEYNIFHHHVNIHSIDEWKCLLDNASMEIIDYRYYLQGICGKYVISEDVKFHCVKNIFSRIKNIVLNNKIHQNIKQMIIMPEKHQNGPFLFIVVKKISTHGISEHTHEHENAIFRADQFES